MTVLQNSKAVHSHLGRLSADGHSNAPVSARLRFDLRPVCGAGARSVAGMQGRGGNALRRLL